MCSYVHRMSSVLGATSIRRYIIGEVCQHIKDRWPPRFKGISCYCRILFNDTMKLVRWLLSLRPDTSITRLSFPIAW